MLNICNNYLWTWREHCKSISKCPAAAKSNPVSNNVEYTTWKQCSISFIPVSFIPPKRSIIIGFIRQWGKCLALDLACIFPALKMGPFGFIQWTREHTSPSGTWGQPSHCHPSNFRGPCWPHFWHPIIFGICSPSPTLQIWMGADKAPLLPAQVLDRMGRGWRLQWAGRQEDLGCLQSTWTACTCPCHHSHSGVVWKGYGGRHYGTQSQALWFPCPMGHHWVHLCPTCFLHFFSVKLTTSKVLFYLGLLIIAEDCTL